MSNSFMKLLLTGLIFLISSTSVFAQQHRAQEVLEYIPSHALMFLHVEGKALWNSSLIDDLRKRIPPVKWKKFEDNVLKQSETINGIARENFQSATLVFQVMNDPRSPDFALMFTSTIPIDQTKFKNGIKKYYISKYGEPAPHESITHHGIELTYIGTISRDPYYAAILQDHIAAIGDAGILKSLINQKRSQGRTGPLTAAIQAAAGHDIALGIATTRLLRNYFDAVRQQVMEKAGVGQPQDTLSTKLWCDVLQAALELDTAHVQLDIQKDVALKIKIEAEPEKSAIRFQRLLEASALMGEFGVQHLMNMSQMKAFPDMRELDKFFPLLQAAFSNSTVKRSGTTVEFSLNAPSGGPALMAAASGIFVRIALLQDRTERQSNLRMLAIAMHNYHNDYNKLPAAGYYPGARNHFQPIPKPGSNDKPLLSWRVAILPYTGHDKLYVQFRLNEPWDSEHNKKLIPFMPKIYLCPGAPETDPGKTYLQVFVAPEKPANTEKQVFAPIFQYGRPPLTLGQLTVQDGTSNTMLIAEGANPVIWTKPDDLLIEDDEKPLPKLGCVPDEDDFLVVFGDGSVRSIRRALGDMKQHERLLRQMIGRRDGKNEEVDPVMK